jgi:hypothetical protein
VRAGALLAALTLAAAGTAAHTAEQNHPDLTGVWAITAPVPALKTAQGQAPPLKPEARTVYDAHRAAAAKGDYSFDGMTRCLPPGLPRLMLMREPFEILQREKVIYFGHQVNRLPRRAYLDEKLPTDPDPHYLGYSVAHWDGDALVIESSGFDDSTLLDAAGLPHSDGLHLTERYELGKDGRHLHASFVIDDPATFTRPWTAQSDYVKRTGYELPEEVCAAEDPARRPRL